MNDNLKSVLFITPPPQLVSEISVPVGVFPTGSKNKLVVEISCTRYAPSIPIESPLIVFLTPTKLIKSPIKKTAPRS